MHGGVSTAPAPLQSKGLQGLPGIAHGFFTRSGGVSSGIYASLNCGWGSDDAPDAVKENRARVAACLGIQPEHLITLRQVHSAEAVILDAAVAQPSLIEADAVVTGTPGLAVGVLTADCVPILFADAEARVVAAAHAGWRGAVNGIIGATVTAMKSLGAKPDRIRAGIGPAISAQAYEVGEEFRQSVLALHREADDFFHVPAGRRRPHFDLWAFVRRSLTMGGVRHIDLLNECTCAGESKFFSYRRSRMRNEPDYGRQISAILLR